MTRSAASRDGYGRALLELASNDRVVVLEADLGKSTRSQWFRNEHPDRTISLGIGEQNMMLVAAGFASSGYIPYASTFAIFTERAFEQVRNGIARPGLAVHICGSHGGVHTGTDGSSAQSIEDLAIYRTLPGMTVMNPSDEISASILTKATVDLQGPSYMRTARNATPVLHEGREHQIRIGEAILMEEGADVCILATGVLVHHALTARATLASEGIDAAVVDVHTIKPLDTDLIDRMAATCGALVTAEDHSIIGGLGGAVAEHLSTGPSVPLERVGVRDRFGESGAPDELLSLMGLDAESIAGAARRAIERKG